MERPIGHLVQEADHVHKETDPAEVVGNQHAEASHTVVRPIHKTQVDRSMLDGGEEDNVPYAEAELGVEEAHHCRAERAEALADTLSFLAVAEEAVVVVAQQLEDPAVLAEVAVHNCNLHRSKTEVGI